MIVLRAIPVIRETVAGPAAPRRTPRPHGGRRSSSTGSSAVSIRKGDIQLGVEMRLKPDKRVADLCHRRRVRRLHR